MFDYFSPATQRPELAGVYRSMPILAPEPVIYPPDLLGACREAEQSERGWWVLHTRPRQEKSLARSLYAGELPFFLPLIENRVRVRKGFVTSQLPLFPGYVFVHLSQEERLKAMSSGRVVNSLRAVDESQLRRDLIQVHRLLQSGLPIAPEHRMAPGAMVEIQSGPLAGLRGKIVQEASQKRFVVAVDFIQRGASVLLDGAALMPIRE